MINVRVSVDINRAPIAVPLDLNFVKNEKLVTFIDAEFKFVDLEDDLEITIHTYIHARPEGIG